MGLSKQEHSLGSLLIKHGNVMEKVEMCHNYLMLQNKLDLSDCQRQRILNLQEPKKRALSEVTGYHFSTPFFLCKSFNMVVEFTSMKTSEGLEERRGDGSEIKI